MNETALPIDEFRALVHALIGLPVSLPWKGYGSAIFLELGQLQPLESLRQRHQEGEACISVEWDWRVESGTEVLFGSSNSGPKIQEGILRLLRTTVQGLDVVGRVPEIAVTFSNGVRLQSMVMATGNPEWSIKLPDGRWLSARKGGLFLGDGGPLATEQEEAVFASAERTASRWGIPSAEPKPGVCVACDSFVRLDGDGSLLDYGVCTSAASPFDGRAVNHRSGCPAFSCDADS